MKLSDKILKKGKNGLTEYNWKHIWEISEFKVLSECKQSPKWHGEGNVKNHTLLVCKEALNWLNNNVKSNSEYRTVMLLAALFHDIGKGTTTFEKNGSWHSYGHEIESEKITRRLLWNEGWRIRENVCALVRLHMEPLTWAGMKNGVLEKLVETEKRLISLGNIDLGHIHTNDLILLKSWDVRGSIQTNTDSKANDVANIAMLSKICHGMFDDFDVDYYNVFLNKKNTLENKKPLTVVTLIGLPGSGKDTFLQRLVQEDSDITYINGNTTVFTYKPENVAVLCRDDIRIELGFCTKDEKIVGTTKQEQEVTKIFNDRLLDAARDGKVIVLNNINLKSKYREETLRYLSGYDVKSIYFYIEADSLETNKERRMYQINDDAFDNMITNFDWPKPNEYDEFYVLTT